MSAKAKVDDVDSQPRNQKKGSSRRSRRRRNSQDSLSDSDSAAGTSEQQKTNHAKGAKGKKKGSFKDFQEERRQQRNENRKMKQKCRLCGKPGHLRKECPGIEDGGKGQSLYKSKTSGSKKSRRGAWRDKNETAPVEQMVWWVDVDVPFGDAKVDLEAGWMASTGDSAYLQGGSKERSALLHSMGRHMHPWKLCKLQSWVACCYLFRPIPRHQQPSLLDQDMSLASMVKEFVSNEGNEDSIQVTQESDEEEEVCDDTQGLATALGSKMTIEPENQQVGLSTGEPDPTGPRDLEASSKACDNVDVTKNDTQNEFRTNDVMKSNSTTLSESDISVNLDSCLKNGSTDKVHTPGVESANEVDEPSEAATILKELRDAQEKPQRPVSTSDVQDETQIQEEEHPVLPEPLLVIGASPPQQYHIFSQRRREQLESYCENSSEHSIVGIATGLDFGDGKTDDVSAGRASWAEQIATYRVHLEIAAKYSLPVVLTVLPEMRYKQSQEAERELLNVAMEVLDPEHKVYLSSYAGSPDTVCKFRKQFPNLYVGFSGVMTFRSNAHIKEIAFDCPDDRYLIESNAPHTKPNCSRILEEVRQGVLIDSCALLDDVHSVCSTEIPAPELNSPAMIPIIALCFAKEKRTTLQQVLRQSLRNMNQFFGISDVDKV